MFFSSFRSFSTTTSSNIASALPYFLTIAHVLDFNSYSISSSITQYFPFFCYFNECFCTFSHALIPRLLVFNLSLSSYIEFLILVIFFQLHDFI